MTTPLRILLVQPAWDRLGYRRKIKADERAIHPLTLGVIAALSDPHEVHIVDEAREPVPMSARGFDVVGFSVNTFNAPRAYALADRFRAAGVPVVDELRALPQSIILFVDDNVFCAADYAREVLRAITPLGKRWWIQAPTTIHEDSALIPLMAQSGCYAVSIGFQTASNLTNQNERILQNHVERYGALVRELHRHGILVDGTFMFGFDSDDRGTFDATGDLIARLGLDTYTFYFLTPYPGTEYFAQFEREGRILDRDWSRFDWDHVVVRPLQLSVEELREGVRRLTTRLDRGYFLKTALRHLPIHARSLASPGLMGLLLSTSWSCWRSPVLRD